MREAPLMIAPDAESQEVRIISEGEKVRMLDRLDSYIKVRLPNYEEGWIEEREVEVI